MDVSDILKVMDNEKSNTLCLSKGGFEGWLQSELWYYLNIYKKESTEREVRYPGKDTYCDLVCNSSVTHPGQWVEIKAYGIFRDGDESRFLDSVANDVMKIDSKPVGAIGSVYLIVPKAVSEKIERLIGERRWSFFKKTEGPYSSIYHGDI
ncbi:TPA: hypothetical protein MEC17_000257 [Klebsiella pneumoniae]|uniref:hypothetical protein n=2 Tax=Klebsiella pneumoniae TaxID=573 RepID=UPI000E2AD196|nr:hypothetical protein [Klebsiella pneumoniae]EIX9106402.1 hypothetical protein [Klebsiella pneumoniae]EIY1879753.1 hypothetical protein [Klebsiella pneumoniae]EKJ7635799.1 hypothetical protein [Klebsiella pneumoniae]MCQ0574319.1 hypothetical protein [Klebsiella pneumoniae]MCQ0675299.1 hypothetical protein [Klebsiella pneumoniae]